MKMRKKSVANLALTLAVLTVPATVFANDSNSTNDVATKSSISKNNSTDDASGNSVTPGVLTQDNIITAKQSLGGIGSATYKHFGNFKYDGRAYLQNTGSRIIDFKLYTPTGKLVYSVSLAPGKNTTLPLTQTVLKWDLGDGTGKVTIQTRDGGEE